MTITLILNKPLDQRNRNEITDVIQSKVGLEGHSNRQSFLNHRTSAVARIDRRIGLYQKMGVDSRMDISTKLDS